MEDRAITCMAVHICCVAQVTGRDKEVARVIQILARRSKNNPLLLGEPGVGKTAIAEGELHASQGCLLRHRSSRPPAIDLGCLHTA